MGIFSTRMNTEGAVSGMVAGLGFTAGYIGWFKFLHPELNTAAHWWLGVSPEGIGTLGMLVNFAVAVSVAAVTAPPPPEVQAMVEEIRVPRGAGAGHEVSA
jgi:cation/acetate symporter